MGQIIKPDLSGGDVLVPEGTYTMRIKSAPRLKYGEEKGTPYLTWILGFTGENEENQALFENTMLDGPGRFRTRNILEALGLTKEQRATFGVEKLDLPAGANPKAGVPVQLLVEGQVFDPKGMEVEVKLAVEKDRNGDDKNTVKAYIAKK